MPRDKLIFIQLEKFLTEEVRFVEHKLKLPKNLLSFLLEGKRIRAKLIKHSLETIIELTHASSLIHDDIVDESGLRRGQASAFCLLPIAGASSISYLLFSRLFLRIIRRKPFIYKNYFRTLEEMCIGQIMEIESAHQHFFSIEKYMRTIRYKTGSLFAYCFGIKKDKWNKSDAELGYKFGIAFQILDDLYDVTLDEAVSGKPSRLDAKRGILTLPYLYKNLQKQEHFTSQDIEDTKSIALSFLQVNKNRKIQKDWRDQLEELKKRINSVACNISPESKENNKNFQLLYQNEE